MIWLLTIPAILVCAYALTGMAHRAMERALRPQVCQHPFWMSGRCGQCGTPR